jgi:hypothetical protein
VVETPDFSSGGPELNFCPEAGIGISHDFLHSLEKCRDFTSDDTMNAFLWSY